MQFDGEAEWRDCEYANTPRHNVVDCPINNGIFSLAVFSLSSVFLGLTHKIVSRGFHVKSCKLYDARSAIFIATIHNEIIVL